MADIANPPVPKDWNALMTASGWGTIYVKVQTIGHGISVVSTSSTGRKARTLYITRRTSGSFGVTFICTSYDEYKALGDWIMGYGKRLATEAPSVGPVRMICPSRNFDKVAVPKGVSFGDDAMTHTYPVSIDFIGSRDPVPLTADYVSSFSLPADSDPSLPYYYPAGEQLSGEQTGVDSMFDVPLSVVLPGVNGPVLDVTYPGLGSRAV